ncbi:hypothetical protein [Streptomyces sp. NBC_01422]|nr:hypothetical protein [Streptomyces sp. NBC_01422]
MNATYVVILLLGLIAYITCLGALAILGAAIGADLGRSTTDTDRNNR